MLRKGLVIALIAAFFTLAIAAPTAVQTASAQTSIWYGEYYNNPTLNGTPALTRYDQTIAFNFGTNAPAPEVNADGFSVRWATDASFSPGTYRFFALADDNIRVTFNFNQVVINTFDTTQLGQTVSGDVTVTAAGVYHIQVDYREVDNTAYAYVSYGNLASNPQPNFSVNPGTTPSTGNTINTAPWTVQYYNNPSLSADPVAIQSVPNPSFNYGAGSPLPTVPADNWSARFTSVQNLSGGNYQLSVNVDDGVRVFVNGALVINQFVAATGQAYTANLTLPAGANNFQVDYLEFSGNASLDYRLTQPGVTPTQPPGAITGPSATVTAFRLNVRQSPSATSTILTRINRNETYAILGRDAAGAWYQVNVNNVIGWVSARFVTVNNGASIGIINPGVPPTQPTQAPTQTGITVTATPYTVNIRSGASTTFARIARLPVGQTAQVIGRNASNEWYQINYNGIVGWVTAQYTVLSAGANVNNIPVTG